MQTLTDRRIAELLAGHEPPCISIYLPTSRSYPDSQQNPILYRNLVKEAEAALRDRYPGCKVRGLLAPFDDLADDAHLWTHRLDGMAVFGCPDAFHVIDLPQRVSPRAVVADSFHIKPLLRLIRTTDRYQVLCLTRERVRMLEGDRDALAEVPLKGVPATVTEALGEDVSVQRKEQAAGGKSPGEPRPAPRRPGGAPVGHAAKGDDAQLDAERFFQVIDRAVLERHSRPSGLPLVVAALPKNQAIFRALSHNLHLIAEGIDRDPESLSMAELRDAAWQVVAPNLRERLGRVITAFHTARSRGLASDDLAAIAGAAAAGRVGGLLIDAERHLPDGDDVLDDLAEQVLRQKGAVVALATADMPTRTGAAAIFQY
jgi:hypothetical protein